MNKNLRSLGIFLTLLITGFSASGQGTITAPGTISGTTVGQANDCSMRTTEDYYYNITPWATGSYTFSLCTSTSGFDSYLFLQNGTACGTSTITSNDDGCLPYSTVTATLTVGMSYSLVVEGWAGSGAYTLVTTGPSTGSGCTNTTQYPTSSFAAPAPGAGTYTISSVQYQSEYNQMTGATSGHTFQSTGSIAGTYITVRSGTYNGPLVGAGTSPLNWTAAAGGTYFIHYNTNASCGTAFVSMTSTITNTTATSLPGDNCANAQNLASLTSPYNATTIGYSNDISVCRTGYPDRIFYISVPNGNTIDIWQSTNSYDSYHYMGYGATCPGTTTLYCVDDPDTQQNPWTNNTGATQTVWFIVDGYNGSGTFTLNWSLTAPPSCGNILTETNGTITSTTAAVSWTAGAPTPTDYEIEYGVSPYTFTGTPNITTTSGATSYTFMGLTPATTYQFKIRSDCGGGTFGAWSSTYSFTTTALPPANDACADAIQIASLPFTSAVTSNTSATDDNVGTICAGPYKNVWWKVDGICGRMTATTCNVNSSFDTEIAVFRGACGALTEIACNDDDPSCGVSGLRSTVSWNAEPGVVYYISVGSYFSGGSTGNIQLAVSGVATVATVPAPTGTNYIADYECTESGWTHYYDDNGTTTNRTDDYILLSVNKNGQNIGSVGDGTFAVQVGADFDAGTSAYASHITAPTAPYVEDPLFVVMSRYWTVTPNPQLTADADVRFYFTNNDFNAITSVLTNLLAPNIPAAVTDLFFYKINDLPGPYDVNPANDHNGVPEGTGYNTDGYWEYAPGGAPSDTEWAYGTYGSAHYAEYTIATFSGGGGGSGGSNGNGALPIELLYFTGRAEATANIIEWATASEKNNQYQIVERSANGSTGWSEIGRVAGSGQSTTTKSYKLNDENPLIRGYYRLRAVDFDGAEQLSEVIHIVRNSDVFAIVNSFPVPVERILTLFVNAPVSSDATVTVNNALGQQVLQLHTTLTKGITEVYLDMSELSSGHYSVIIDNGSDRAVQRIVK